MADNVPITPGTGATVAADDVGGILHQRVKLSLGADGVAADAPIGGGVEAGTLRVTIASDSTGVLSVDDNGSTLSVDDGGSTISVDDGAGSLTVDGTVTVAASENHIGEVGGKTALPSANFTRPADTTAYAVGDLVANSTTAGSVTPMSFTMFRVTGKGGMLRRVRLRKSGTSVTNASFRIHFYTTSPTPSNGDNGAWLTNNVANYAGAVDVVVDRAFTDGASGNGIPLIGSEINFTADTYYGLIEARGAYTPANAEVFTVILEVIQN